MTTTIVGGHNLGLLDSSAGLLNRDDRTDKGSTGHGVQTYANVSSGNLMVQEVDAYLPSRGADFNLVRTYNSRGAIGGSSDGWSYSTAVTLSSHQDKPASGGASVTAYLATYGDGSVVHFDFDATRNLWVSTDGAGAYETLQVLNPTAADPTKYRVTRADQSQYNFDKDFVFVSMVDTNAVRTDFTYQGGRIQTVRDDTGHVITYQYDGIGKLASIVDELDNRLVSYGYSGSLLSSVTDRFGHVTTYTYNSNGLLTKISLPFQQTINGQLQTFETRELQFTYQSINWDDHPHVVTPFDAGSQWALSSIIDALGGVTTFESNFIFDTVAVQPGDRDLAYKQVGGRYFAGGTTRVVDAMGNGLATSNSAEFQQKRLSLGFAADVNTLTQAQKDALRQQFSLNYAFDPDGYITQVVDQQGFKTTYVYGGKTIGDPQTAVNQDNLLSVVDRNGWGATNSDSAYFRALRKDISPAYDKPVALLTAAEKIAILARFTTTFTYDARGNLLTRTDGQGNQTSYTYTSFNKVASETTAMGNALTTLNDLVVGDNFYRAKRVELGFPNGLAASLTAAQKTALLNLYTTTYAYDARQNLITRTDAGGDVTRFEYDVYGNLTRRTVEYRDASGVAVAAKNQVTTYAYDVFGNNVSMVDAEGHVTTRTYDQFGNLLTMVDGRGGISRFTYDADNRLLTQTDPEGHLTVNAYDAVGNRIAVTDANGHTVTSIYDRNNRLVGVIDPAVTATLTRNTTFKYDILGNQTEATDAEGRRTTYRFDARRQLIDVATPQVLNGAEALVSYHTTYAYDGEGNVVTQVDNNGNLTQLLYNSIGLLKRQTDAIGNVTEFLFDANLAQVQITIGAQLAPALRRVLKFDRDEENQITAETDALGHVTRTAYDAPGNVVAVTDANGNKTDFEYDRDNRLIKETRATVTHPVTGLPVRYTVLHQYDANDNEVSTTDENGRVTRYAFDKDNRAVLITDANGIKTAYVWDSRDNHTQIAIGVDAHMDANSHVVIDSYAEAAVSSYVYDEFNQVIAVTDAVGNALVNSDLPVYQNLRAELGFAPLVANLTASAKTTLLDRFTDRYEFDRVGNRTRSSDHLGRISTFTYDALDRLQSNTDALGTAQQRSTQRRYDGNGNLVKLTDSLGRVVRFTYDGNDRLVDETDPLGVVTHSDYDNVGNLTARVRAFGSPEARSTRYIYDLDNRLTRETDPEDHFKTYEYDAVGNRLKEIDAKGGATQFVYDALNRLIKIIDPLSFQTRYEYDGVGNNITMIDANGGIRRLQYDGTNRTIQTTDAVGRVTRFEYDRLDHIIKQTTAFGLPEAEETRYAYDALGNLRQVTDAAGNVSTQGFDAVYNLTRSTDQQGRTTTTAFDALNRQIQVTDALGGITTYTYDLEGNQLTETDALGHTRSFAYDAKNRLITQTDAFGTQTTFAYDAVDNQISITRAANRGVLARTDTFVYNKDDKLIRQTDALGHATLYTYDANHNVITTTDALGRVTNFSYDADNRLVRLTDPLGHVTQFKYDGKGNRTQVIDGRGNTATTYYNHNNEIILTVDGEGNAVATSYDGNGNVKTVREYMTPLTGAIDPAAIPTPVASLSDRTTTVEYDKLNRQIKRTDALGGVALRAYDAVGNLVSLTDENGHTKTFEYDALNRAVKRIDPLLGERIWTYDAVGNELSETDENGHTRSFAYDLEDRLINETDPLGGVKTYTYDAVHNRLSETDENGHTMSFTYDLAGRRVSETDALLGTRHFAYDAADNQISTTDENGHTTTFTYDADDRLITRTDALGGVRSSVYDALDNLISETDENGHTRSYTYDKNNRRLAKTDPLGGVQSVVYDAVGNTTRRTDENGHTTVYTYDANDRLIKQTDPLLGVRSFGYDAVGNRLSETDENGHTTNYVYDANDRLIRGTNALGDAQLYTYDAVGNRTSLVDENGHKTVFEYDANDRLTKRIDALLGERTITYDAVGLRLSTTDENGHTTRYTYDALDRLIKEVDALLGERLYTYDAVGNQLSATDENGHVTSNVYDANDRLVKQTDPLLHDQLFTYDAAGNRLSATDENGHKTSYVYDGNDRLIKQIDPLLGERTFGYDAVGNLLSRTDQNGHRTRYVYDGNDRLIKQIDPLLGASLYAYDAAGNRLSETDQNGHTTRFGYDADNRLVSRTDALGKVRTIAYDAVGNRTGVTDENGHTTSYAFDQIDRLIKQTDALGKTQLYAYDAAGNRLSISDENGHLTRYVYDANNRLTEQKNALDGVQRLAYDAVGNVLSRTDENGHVTSFVYDDNDRLTQQTDALLGVRKMVYDAVGNLLSSTDENDHRTSYLYDANDRLIKQIDPLAGERAFSYDAAGNRLSETDENGHTVAMIFDANDRLIKRTDALGKVRSFAYDAVGNLTGLTDENAHTTTYAYDAVNRQIGRTDALGKTLTTAYDAVGNRVAMTDENGHTTGYAFDANNREVSRTDALGKTQVYVYDGVGNRTKMTDENGNATSYAFDDLDRLITQTDALGGIRRFAYDAVGNRLSMTDENGHVTSYVYDANDRMVSETDPLLGKRLYTYDAAGNRLTETDQNGHTITFVFDANDRQISRTDPLGEITLSVYDAVGNRISLTDKNGHTTAYAYDANNRLSLQTDALLGERSFTYDGVGNQASMTDENGHLTRYAYDANDRLISTTNALGDVQTYRYDDAGNRISRTDENGNITTYAYDARNRLSSQTDPLGKTRSFAYDAVDNRTALTDENGHTTHFAFDALNRLTIQTDALGNTKLYEYDAVGNRTRVTDENGHSTGFVYDANDRRISRSDALGNTSHQTYDAVGNVLSDTDENGRVTRFSYDANDRLIARTDALGNTLVSAYDAAGNRVSLTDENGHVIALTYDALDRLVTRTDALGGIQRYSYDKVGNQLSETDENGHVTRYTYDAKDRQSSRTDALGKIQTYGYDAVGNRTRMTDENGHVTTYAFDGNNRQLSQTDALGHTRSFAYDDVGNRIGLTDENGHTTTYGYDANNRQISLVDALGHTQTYGYDGVGNRIRMTDENGHDTTYAYDALDRLITRTDPLGGVQRSVYDAVGNRITQIDENGHRSDFAYDALDRQIERTDALGQKRITTYDAVGNALSVTDENGHQTQFSYDALNRLATQTDPLGGVRSFVYDAVGNRTQQTDENGHTTRYSYDADDREITRTDALGKIRLYAYDFVGNRVGMTDENGHATVYGYDDANRLTTQTNALGGVMTRAYDAAGNLIGLTDENGHTITSEFDASDRLVKKTDALGGVMTYAYDAAGNSVSDTDQNGHTTTYAYDALHRVTRLVDALGFATTMSYDGVGNVLQTRQQLSLINPALQQITRHAYDALDRRVASLSAEGFLKTYEYDALDHVVKTTVFDNRMAPTASGAAPLTGTGPSRVMLASYDANDRLVTETSALGFVTRYEYDDVGNRTARIEAADTIQARRTQWGYDALDRLTDTVDALGLVTHTVYDAVGNALELHEAFGRTEVRVTQYQYDAIDRVAQKTDALGIVNQYFYDAAGDLIECRKAVGRPEARTEHFEYDAKRQRTAHVNGEGERTEFAYDGVGNRTSITVARGLPAQRINRMRYDGDNRLIGQIDGNGVETQYHYDGAGNKIRTVQLAATYDSDGNFTGTYQGQSIAGLQRESLFAYDLDNRLIQVTDPMGGVSQYVLDVLGNRTLITDANGTQTVNTFDAGGRLLTNRVIGSNHGGVLVSNQYDAFGNIVQSRRGFHDGSDTRQTTYTYDKRNRQLSLTEYDKVDNLGPATVFAQGYSAVFEYDAFDNQTKIARGFYLKAPGDAGYDAAKAALAHPLIATFSYDEHDKLTRAVDGVGNVIAYGNDAFGNRIAQTSGFDTLDSRVVTFRYDHADRLTARTTATGGLVKLTYDEAGNQTRKDTLQSGTETGVGDDAPVWVTERFDYDGNGRVIGQTDGLGTRTEHVLDAFGKEIATRFAAGTADERTARFEYNANNDLTAEVDALGHRTRYELDPMGNRIAQTDALGFVTRLYYNELNQQIAVLDPEGFLTTFGRDSAGNVLETRVYGQHYTAPSDARTAPTTAAADTTRITRNEYDGAGNRVRKIDPDQRVREFVYDSAGKLRRSTDFGSSLAAALALTADANPRVQTFDYDAAGRVIRFTEVDGVTEAYAYDTANNKISTVITNPQLLGNGTSDPVRTTLYQYDADNRQTGQIFDPAGINKVETLTYDKAGNVIAKTDALGNVTVMTYDLANRRRSITDAVGGTIQFAYDRVGNRTGVIDARGNETQFEYDKNNRVVKALFPAVDVFTIRDGLQTNVRPFSETRYDAVGNVVQEIAPSGFKSTAFYDGNHNRIAEINGDNTLRTFSYDASGLLISASLYMTRVDAAAHDVATPPAAPSVPVRTIRSEYDLAGRIVRTVYPSIEATHLSGVDTANPVASTATVTPEERHRYNAFGERVQSTDRNGNISFAYFDSRGRAVATVDSAGYLIESAYDDQGNVVQQRKYGTPLDLDTVSAGTRPAAPGGAVYTIDRKYDAANRLIEELSPPVAIDGAVDLQRVATRFDYDDNGNLISKTLAAGSPEAATEHYYYDAAHRQVAIVTAGRVLHQVGYDANGNKTSLKRFIDPVSAGVDLNAATLTELLADVTPDATQDQKTTFTYDALNRETQVSDQMGPGTADDITISSKYDTASNLTWRADAGGFVSQTAYDALGHITQTRTPDGNRSFVQYDAAGFKIRAWTGDLGSNQAVPATNVSASIGSALGVSWQVTGDQLTSYLVYDTVAHDLPADYANESGQQGSGAASIDIALADFPAGTQVYFRVVTVDAAGSKAWTDEYTVTVPVLLSNLSVEQAGSDLNVIARFNGAITNPVLLFGQGQALNTTVAMVLQADGSYKASLTNPSQGGQGLSYQVRWSVGGNTYTTSPTPFEAPGLHEAIDGTFIWPVPLPAQGDAQVVLLDGIRQESAFQVNGQLQFTPTTLANGSHVYHVLYGQSVSESHDFTVTNLDHQTATPGAVTDITNGNGDVIGKSRTFTFQHGYSTQIQVAMDAAEANRAAASLQVGYRAAGATGLGGFTTVAATRTGNTFSATAALAPGDYDIKVSYLEAGSEVIVQWRRITVAATALHTPVVQQDLSDPFDFAGQPGQLTDDLTATAWSLTGAKSMTVVGRETDGDISKLPNGDISVDPGLYTGPVDPANASFVLPVTTTTSAGADSAKADGLVAASYFTEIEYNALGTKIATNEDSGQWRRFGVDANGNALVTRVYGTQADETAGRAPITTYSAFDARNLEFARFGAVVAIDANGDGVEEASTRAVSRVTYDYAGRRLTQLDPKPGALAQQFEYDGVGNLIRSADGLGFVTQMFYDRRGHEVRRIDARGNTRRTVYDLAGRRIREIDALNNATNFAFDAFDRQISQTDALGHGVQMAYDQRDRLVQQIDGLGNATQFTYDKRDNRIWTEDANHHFFGQAFDAMGRVTNTYSFQSPTSASVVGQALIDVLRINPTPTTLAQATDAVSNAASPYRAALVNTAIAYDIYGNKRSETDAQGRQKFYAYGAFGRLEKQTDEGGRVTTFGYDRFGRSTRESRAKDATVTGAKNITRTYDDSGRLKSVTDLATLVSTTYTYDVAGARMHETIKAPNFFQIGPVPTARNITYHYDALGRMLSWSDAVTGKNLHYGYDAVGNQTSVSGSDGVDHRYTFDANDRLTQELQGASTLIAAYTYDAAGHRRTFNNGATTATYTYDAADRVVRADISPNATPSNTSDDSHMTWQYDAVGNVTRYQELAPATLAVMFSQTNRYTASNRTQQTSVNDQRDPDAKSVITTLNALDKTGRVLVEGRTDSTDPDHVKTTTYTHVYAKDGRELSITATGTDDKTGNTKVTYDANDRMVKLDLGKGDGQDSNEFRLFINNNDGQILRRFYDDGKNDNTNPRTEFLYANGNPVGETGSKTDGSTETVLDRGNYTPVQNMGDEFPDSAFSEYVVKMGDTLQSVAARVYGNPSLWFVIAQANGLTGSEALKEGARLSIPNTVQAGRLTADTHSLYQESDIVGSRLPNLITPAPSGPGAICAIIGAIILAILIAILAIIITIVTVGVGTPAAAALLGVGESAVATTIVGVTIGVVVGTVVAAAASAISQGINIAFGLQREFDWKQFAGDIAGGVLGGVGAFFSGAAQALTSVARISTGAARIAQVTAVGVDVAFQVAGEAVSQVIAHDGRLEQPWMLGVAAGAGIAGEVLLGVLGPRAIRAIGGAQNTAGDVPTPTRPAPVKRVQFADNPEFIQSKPVADLAKANDLGVGSTLKSADTQFSDANGSASLKLKNSSESLAGNDNTASFKPLTVEDSTSSTLSLVQSPNPLDEGVGLREAVIAKKLISGNTADIDQRSVTDFEEGLKVENNSVPIVERSDDEVFPLISPSLGKREVQGAKVDDPVDALDQALPEWPAQKLQRLIAENGATFELRNKPVRDYGKTHARYTEDLFPLQRSAVGRDQAGTRIPTIEQRGQARMQMQFKEVFDVGTENVYIKESRIKDTEAVVSEKIEKLRVNAQQDGPQALADRLARADTYEMLGLVGYTAKTAAGNQKAVRLGKAADLNYYFDPVSKKKIPQERNGVPDFEYINPVLRQYEGIDQDAKRALDKSFDAYITYAVRGLGNLESHEGTVYRGGNFSHKMGEFNAQFKEGQVFTEKGFLSTTRDETQSFRGDTLFVINSRGGGRRIEDISDAPYEAEVLFPPASRFKVLKIEELGADTKVLQSDGDHAVRQRVVYMDELPAPKLTAVGKQRPESGQPFTQDAVLQAPTGATQKQGLAKQEPLIQQAILQEPIAIGRQDLTGLIALRPLEYPKAKLFREPHLDAQAAIKLSAVDARINPKAKSSWSTERTLKNYSKNSNAEFARTPEGRKQQLMELDRKLGKVRSDKPLGKSAQDETTLLTDTSNDPAILSSPYVVSPTHALELKRLGLQPSEAGQVGQFTDTRLKGKMKVLGSGGFNTVYTGKYKLPNGEGSYQGVFKPEVRGGHLPDVAPSIGIRSTDIRAGYRNVATTRLDDLLGLGGLTTRSEMAIHNHRLGTVSERAQGVSPKGKTVLGNDSADQAVQSYMRSMGVSQDRVVAAYNAEGGRQVGMMKVNGEKKYFFQDESMHDINYNDPTLRRDLVRLQLMDSIAGQVDRHIGNYFVKQDIRGNVAGVKGIDNDLSWGSKLKTFEDQGGASHLPKYLPPVVDAKAYDSIMSQNRQTLKQSMRGLLTKPEIEAANDRLLLVQGHLRTLQSEGRVLKNDADWSSPRVTQLLMAEKNATHTNYIARDVGVLEYKRSQGLVIPYPVQKGS